MSHIFQICPIAFASHGDNVPYDIFSFKITAFNWKLLAESLAVIGCFSISQAFC